MQVVCPGFVGTPLTDKNDFPMPFLIPAEDAARRICDGFERAGFEIAFPRRMAWMLKAINLLPYAPLFSRSSAKASPGSTAASRARSRALRPARAAASMDRRASSLRCLVQREATR